MKKKILFIITISFFITISLFFIFESNKENIQLSLNTPREINKELKLYKSISFKKRLSLMKENNDNLFFVCWENGEQGKLYNYDLIRNQLKKYDFNKNDSLFIIGDFLLENNFVFLHDKLKNRIIKINLNNPKEYKNVYNYPKDFTRLGKADNNFIISGWDKNYNIFFEKYSLDKDSISRISVSDSYLNKYKKTGISLDGKYYTNNTNTVMIPYSVNKIFKFDENLNYINGIDLIYGETEFKFRENDKTNIYTDPNNLNPNLSGFLSSKNYLYILTDESTQFNTMNKCFIDIYDVNNNKYLESFKINDFNQKKPRYITMYNDYILILFDNNLNFYKIEKK